MGARLPAVAVPPLFRGCTGAVSVLARGLTEGGEPDTNHLCLLGVPIAALVTGGCGVQHSVPDQRLGRLQVMSDDPGRGGLPLVLPG
jgi:hypothetical protein